MLKKGAATTGQNSNNLGGANAALLKSDKFKVRVFINMDEDDDGAKGIKPNDLFQREDPKLPHFADVSTGQTTIQFGNE